MGGHISSNEIFVYIIYTLVNFLSIHSAVCVEPALSVRGWICVTPKIMSQCSVTFVSHEYMASKKHLQHVEQLQFRHGYGRNEEGQWPHLYGMKRLVWTMLER